jgi:hypothetical protein
MTITPPKPETLDKIRAGDAFLMRRVLARAWLELQGDTSLPHAVEGSRIRHSWAAKCARALRYEIDGVPASNPPDVASQWTFRLGHLVHDEIQGALVEMFPDCAIEVKYPNPEVDGSFTLDAEIRWNDAPYSEVDGPGSDAPVHVVEIKSINGFGFKKMIGTRGKAEGPRHSALLQLALNANATPGCTGGWLIYASLENISVGEAERNELSVLDRFLKVTWYPIDQLTPLAVLEEKRMRQVLDEADAGTKTARVIPDPDIPPDAVVIDPTKGTYAVLDANGGILDTGSTWQCDYCNFRTTCIEDGA